MRYSVNQIIMNKNRFPSHFLIITVGYLLCGGCQSAPFESPGEGINDRSSHLTNIRLSMMEEDRTVALIRADKAVINEKMDKMGMENVVAQFFTSQIETQRIKGKDRPDWIVSIAPTILYFVKENRVEIEGPVLTVSSSGLHMQSSNASYRFDKRVIDFGVSIVHDKQYMAATSKVSIDMNSKIYRLERIIGTLFSKSIE